MTVPFPAGGIFARNFEVSFLFPETAAGEAHRFLADRLARYHYRQYAITDLYFPLDANGETLTARQRTEDAETANLIIPCKAHRYLVVPGVRPAAAKTVLLVEKQRDDWTLRDGPRLRGRHYGSFARISIDTGETATLADSERRRTFPGSNVIEFEYAGSGKSEIVRLLGAFRAFCTASAIRLTERPRGVAHRMAVLARD